MRRKSLAELQQEDELGTQEAVVPPVRKVEEKINTISEKRNMKSEFVKMSITVEPEIFEAIEDLSRARRKQKEPFTFSAIVRDALKQYLADRK